MAGLTRLFAGLSSSDSSLATGRSRCSGKAAEWRTLREGGDRRSGRFDHDWCHPWVRLRRRRFW
jgi:hypothetical protein